MKVCGARSRSVECIAALRRHNTPSKCRWIPRAPADFHYRSSLLLFFRYFKKKKDKKTKDKNMGRAFLFWNNLGEGAGGREGLRAPLESIGT